MNQSCNFDICQDLESTKKMPHAANNRHSCTFMMFSQKRPIGSKTVKKTVFNSLKLSKTVKNVENVRYCAENVRNGAKNVHQGAKSVCHGVKNVRHGAENVPHGAENVTHGANNDIATSPLN